jgi:hypothetical protein
MGDAYDNTAFVDYFHKVLGISNIVLAIVGDKVTLLASIWSSPMRRLRSREWGL